MQEQSTAIIDINQESVLVGVSTCLKIIFPDEESRPSIRAFNEWKNKGYFPQVKIGSRVFLDPVSVRQALDKNFTMEARGI